MKMFSCSYCKTNVKFDYFGKSPSHLKNLIVKEDVYVIKDPFTNERNCIILGSHCCSCNKPVCVSPDCSIFYCKRYCLPCSINRFDEFPKEIQDIHLSPNSNKKLLSAHLLFHHASPFWVLYVNSEGILVYFFPVLSTRVYNIFDFLVQYYNSPRF